MNDILAAPPAPALSAPSLSPESAIPPSPGREFDPARSGDPRPSRELIALAVLGVGPFLPLLIDHLMILWSRPHYQFFPIVFIAAFALARMRIARFNGWQPGYSRIGIAGMAIAYVGLAYATITVSPWLGYLSLLVMLTAISHFLGGFALIRQLAGVGVLLATVLPPPLNFDQSLINGLQGFATRQAGRILDVIGVPHLRDGNTIIVPDRTLFVEEACSGIHSLTSVLVVTLIYLVWRERSWLSSSVILALSALWVLAANVVRIVVIAYAQAEYGRDLASGMPHQILGIVLFLGCAGLVLSSDCLVRLFHPGSKASPAPLKSPSMSRRVASIAFPWKAAAAALGIACFLLTTARMAVVAFSEPPNLISGSLRVEDSLMPSRWQSFQRNDAMSHATRSSRFSYGDHSDTWVFRSGRWQAIMSLDYPFSNFHALETCYVGQGWQMLGSAPASHARGTYFVVDLSHPEHGTGKLYYALVTEDGKFHGKSDDPTGLLDRHWKILDKPKPPSPKFQVQVMLRGQGVPTPAVVKETEGLFFEATDRVIDHLSRRKGGQP